MLHVVPPPLQSMMLPADICKVARRCSLYSSMSVSLTMERTWQRTWKGRGKELGKDMAKNLLETAKILNTNSEGTARTWQGDGQKAENRRQGKLAITSHEEQLITARAQINNTTTSSTGMTSDRSGQVWFGFSLRRS